MAALTSALASILMFLAIEGHSRPWPARHPPVKPPPAHELLNLERWPPEPVVPAPVDKGRFREALAYLCRRPADEVPAAAVLTAARAAGVDPFLLGALMREQSRCDRRRTVRQGYGLLGIQPDLYLEPGAPPLPIDRRALATAALLSPLHNLMVGARLLRMWQDRCPDLDEAFGSVPHRTAVAHFLWGDRVLGSGVEDAILTSRRRLIARYNITPEDPRPTPLGVAMVSPLEGVPRVASSGPGDDRDGGLRRHRGLDIVASDGEPVRAVADGVVIFAGINQYGAPRKGPIPPSKIDRYRARRLGVGGIYLCIRHDRLARRSSPEVVSCYMHLSSYIVAAEQRVRAGETIAFVGHTGVRNSPTHLHFEIRLDDQAQNPMQYFADLVIPPKATRTYQHIMANKRARIRAARAATRLGSGGF